MATSAPTKPPLSDRNGLALALSIGFAASLGACASVIDNRAEAIIHDELPRLVGPAREYRVEAGGVAPSSGRLQTVHVVGDRIARPGAPVIDRAEVSLRDVHVDRNERRLIALGGADARARVLAADIAAHLDARPGLDAVEVQFHGDDEIAVSAVPSIAGFTLPSGTRVRLRGHLVPRGPHLNLEVTDLRAAGFPIGTWPKFALETLLNPIVDLSRLPAPARIDRARVEGEALIIEASGVTSVTANAQSSALPEPSSPGPRPRP